MQPNAFSTSTPTYSPPQRDETKIHIPAFMPFFWLACSVIVGAVISEVLDIPWKVWAIGVALSASIWVTQILRRNRLQPKPNLPIGMVFFFLFLTGMCYQISLPANTPEHLKYYNGRGLVEIIGVVSEPPEQQGNATNLVIKIQSLSPLSSDPLQVPPDQVKGKLLLKVPAWSTYVYGDQLSIQGELADPPEGTSFSYRSYLAHQGIYSYSQFSDVKLLDSNQGNPVLAAIYRLRGQGNTVLKAIFPEPESALLRGILLGDESGISSHLASAYALTGTAHIIAISGFNIALLAGLITRLFTKKMGPYKGALLTVSCLAVYTLLVGASASVVRAAIMGSFAVIGTSIHRRGSGLNSLGISVFLMVLVNPHLPWDVGFQLSAMATLGLVLFSQPLQARIEKRLQRRHTPAVAEQIASAVGEYLLTTLSAQTLVLPLLLFHFREISLLFLIANPLILPAQPLILSMGLIGLGAGLIWLPLGNVLAWLAWPFAAYTNRVVLFLADLAPNAWIIPKLHLFWVAAYYIAFLLLVLPTPKTAANKLKLRPEAILMGLGSLVLVLWVQAFSRPSGQLALRILGDSQQPVLLAETPTGRYLLMGGALDASSLTEQLGEGLPPFHRNLDILLIPSCKKDDVTGLFGLAGHIQIGEVLWACDPDSIYTTQRLYQSFQDANILQRRLSENLYLDLGKESQAHYTLADDALESIQFNYKDFTARVDYSDGQDVYPVQASVWIGATLPESQNNAAVQTRTLPILTENVIASPTVMQNLAFDPILSSSYHWLEVTSDGRQYWITARN